MAVQLLTSQLAVVEFLAQLAGEHPAVRELWWRPKGDELELWLFTEPRDYEAEKALHSLQLVLADRYRDVLFDLDIVDVRYLQGSSPTVILPADAERISLGRQ